MAKPKISINNIEEIVASIAMIITIFAIVINIIFGITTGKRYGQLEELSVTAFVWVTFIGIGVAYKHGAHICIDFIVETFPKTMQKIVQILVHLLVILFSAYVIYVAGILAIEAIDKKTALLGISYLYIDMSAVIGFTSLLVRSAIDLVKLFKVKKGEGV